MQPPPIKIDLEKIFGDHCQLPPLPKAVQEVLAATKSGRVGAREVGDILQKDAAFAGHILKIVNSAYYSLPARVSDIRFAVAYLGLSEISRIALSLSVVGAIAPGDKKISKTFWERSYLSALVAKRVSKEISYAFDFEELHSAALLFDIGTLLYARFFPQHHQAVLDYAKDNSCTYRAAEIHLQLPDHMKFGALLCEHWNLPKTIHRACSFHELEHLQQLSAKEDCSPMDTIICVSNVLTILSSQPLTEETKQTITDEVMRVMGYEKDHFLLVMGDIYDLKLKAEEEIKQLL